MPNDKHAQHEIVYNIQARPRIHQRLLPFVLFHRTFARTQSCILYCRVVYVD